MGLVQFMLDAYNVSREMEGDKYCVASDAFTHSLTLTENTHYKIVYASDVYTSRDSRMCFISTHYRQNYLPLTDQAKQSLIGPVVKRSRIRLKWPSALIRYTCI